MYYLNLIINGILIFSLISCGPKTRPSNSKTVETISALDLKRNAFAEDILNPMKVEIEASIELYEKYSKYRKSTQDYSDKSVAELRELKNEFVDTYGERAQGIKSHIDQSKLELQALHKEMVAFKKEVDEDYTRVKQEETAVKKCSLETKNEESSLKSYASNSKNQLARQKKNIDAEVPRLKSYVKAAVDEDPFQKPFVVIVIQNRLKNLNQVVLAYQNRKSPPKLHIDFRQFKRKKKIKRALNHITHIENMSISMIKNSQSIETSIKQRSAKLTKKANTCSKKNEVLSQFGENLKAKVNKLESMKKEYDSMVNEIASYVESNSDFYNAYKEYQNRNDVISGLVYDKNQKLIKAYKVSEQSLSRKYSRSYLEIYKKLVEWVSIPYLDGQQTISIINFINSTNESSDLLIEIKTRMVDILQIASDRDEVSHVSFGKAPKRKIAGLLDDVVGGMGNAVNGALNSINKTLKGIKIPKIKINIPKIQIVDIRIDTGNINLSNIDTDIKIASIDLSDFKVADMNLSEVVNLDFSDIKILDLKVDLPDIDILEIGITIKDGIGKLFEDLKDIEIVIPKAEFVRIEVDIEKDLKNPMNIIHNGADQLRDAKEDIDRELTNAYQDLKREADETAENASNELKRGLDKTKVALEAAGKPENLARMAIVYTASVYGGPMGSAMANSLLDKLTNPDISDQQLFNSFLIGAASGYAAEGVSELPIDSLKSMPNATSAIVRNLTKDAGNVILNGDDYRAEDFFVSIATGAANVSTGDDFVSEIIDSTVNAGKDYALDRVIKKEEFDEEAFTNALYKGMAEGITRESIHALMDEYVIKYIPEEHKRLDKKLIAELKESFADLFLTQQQIRIEKEIEAFENLSPEEKEAFFAEVQRLKLEILIANEELLNKDISKMSEAEIKVYNEKVQELVLAQIEAQAGNNDKFTSLVQKIQGKDEGRKFAGSLFDTVVTGLVVYGVAEVSFTAYDLMNGYHKYKEETGKSFEEYVESRDAEFAAFAFDIITAGTLSQFKILTKIPGVNSKNIGTIMSSVKKLGVKTKEGIKTLVSFKKQKEVLNGLEGAAKHEFYKRKLRQSMPMPDVQDSKLKQFMKNNYRDNAKVGSGSTADALRQEKLTGNTVGGKWHEQKARNQVDGLRKWLDNNPKASNSDKAAAEQVMLDLMDALGDI